MKRYILLFGLAASINACDLQDPAVGVDVSQIISLEAEKLTLLADGLDRATLTATLGTLADANQEITFFTEDGKFAEADSGDPKMVTLVASGKSAEATLISSTTVAEEVIVNARVTNFVAPLKVTYERAYPQDLTVVADKQTVGTDRIDFAEVTIQLFRNSGSPSNNARIDFEVMMQDTATAEVLPFAYTVGSTAIVHVKSGNGKPGNVTLKCITESENGANIERELEVTFEE
ncbi:MAG: hypothetical protein KDC34_16785 [Saprospiraceae bacterium]|nr:hypothetical protein [Saprospiraceae bacterium]